MKAKTAFIYFNLIDKISYTNLLKLYSIAEYNKSTRRYDTIRYKTQKDLAELLGLPRDYIYKYIKGIRSKLEEDTLSNATKGGFVLKV